MPADPSSFADDPTFIPMSRELESGKCLVFAGAGVSVAAGLPTWGALAATFREESRVRGDYSAIRMADCARQVLGPRAFNELLRTTVGAPSGTPVVHQALLDLPVDTVVTTNFDTLFEQEIHRRTGHQPTVLTHNDKTRWLYLPEAGPSIPRVLKIHGCLERTPTECVITEEDFLAYSERYPHVVQGLAELLARRPVVFVGYSLSDWNVATVLWQLSRKLGTDLSNRYFIGLGLEQAEVGFLHDRHNLRVLNLPSPPGQDGGDWRTDALVRLLRELHEYFQVPAWLLSAGSDLWVADPATFGPKTKLTDVLPDVDVTSRVRLALRLEEARGARLRLPDIIDPALTLAGLVGMVQAGGHP